MWRRSTTRGAAQDSFKGKEWQRLHGDVSALSTLMPLLLFLMAVVFVSLPSVAAATVVPECAWVYSAVEGEPTVSVLKRQWDHDACAGGYVSLTAIGNTLPGLVIPNRHLAVLQYTPPTTGLLEGNVRYVSQDLSVRCNVFTPLCDAAVVYYVVHGAENTTTNTTEAPVTPEVVPVCPDSGILPEVMVNVTIPTRLDPIHHVGNCVSPQQLVVTSTSSNTSTGTAGEIEDNYFSIEANNTLWFDRNAENKNSGAYSANLTVYCGGVASCFDVQVTVVVLSQPTEPDPTDTLPNCSDAYKFNVTFMQHAVLTITPHVEDTCQAGNSPFFTLVSPPKHAPEKFRLNETSGVFEYIAAEGPEVVVDTFVFSMGCIADGSAMSLPLCRGEAQIRAAAEDKPPKEVVCPGNFVFEYDVNGCGDDRSNKYDLFLEVTSENSIFCPGGNYTGAQLRTMTTGGSITEFNKKGSFRYVPLGGDVDHFEFALFCADGGVCVSNATMQPSDDCTPAGAEVVHDLGSIVCRGTCDAAAWRSSSEYPRVFDVTEGPDGKRTHVTPRLDGKSPDAMDFSIRADGKSLLLRAYTTIGNMAARFVTFMPLRNLSDPYLTSDYVPRGSNPSFNAACLDRQAKFGLASSIWQWDVEQDDTNDGEGNDKGNGSAAINTGHLNRMSNVYRSKENYFQKFGGKHRDCDVYRRDPCKYAPMLTPASATEDGNGRNITGSSAIDWKLYINNCDATWVGNISLERLRLLRNPVTNAPFFRTVNETMLVGKIYTQVVKPASWVPPYSGILSMQRKYKVRLSIRNSILTDVKVTQVGVVGDKTKPAAIAKSTQASGPLGGASADMLTASADVRVAASADPLTGERLYSYSVLLYPYQLKSTNARYNVPSLVHINATQLRVTTVTLLNASWVVPNPQDCPHCTGKDVMCNGVGDGFNLNCDPLIRFEPIETVPILLQELAASIGSNQFLNISFIARVVGRNTANSTPNEPVGSFALSLRFSNGQSATVGVEHFAYMTGINPVMPRKMCRASAYWPVVDPLGDSLPVKPFDFKQMTYDIFNKPLDGEDEKDRPEKYYGPPQALNKDDDCIANGEPRRPVRVVLNSSNITIYNEWGVPSDTREALTTQLQLCKSPDEKQYHATEWVYVSLHNDMQHATQVSPSESMSLEYLILSVNAGEVLKSFQVNGTSKQKMLHFLLDGVSSPDVMADSSFVVRDEGRDENKAERQKWMGDAGPLEPKVYLPWEKYAASLYYRRIHVRLPPTDNTTHGAVVEPFHFTFVPGALLHHGSSALVTFYLHAAVRFASSRGNGESHVEEIFYTIPVSSHVPSESSFASGVWSPDATSKDSVVPNTESYSALFIFLLFAIAAVLVVALRVERHYKNALLSCAKYQEGQFASGTSHRNAARAVGSGGGGAAVGGDAVSKTSMAAPTNGVMTCGIRTHYGVVQVEQNRFHELGENGCNVSSPPHDTLPVQAEQEEQQQQQPSTNGKGEVPKNVE